MEIIQMMTDYGADTLVIALCTVIFTGLFKIPIKKLAEKSQNCKKITRFITFLPIFIGFGLTVLCTYLLVKSVNFNKEFYVKWLSSVSLSLAIYAFWEKFVPSEKKILSEAEIEANKAVVDELKNKIAETSGEAEAEVVLPEVDAQEAVKQRKIIISRNKN